MSTQNIAKLNAVGVDVAVTTTSGGTAVQLPFGGSLIMIKNVGSNEAFVRGGGSNVSVASASAASGMSVPAGAIEVFETNGYKTIYVAAICGAATTTLRIYPVDGK